MNLLFARKKDIEHKISKISSKCLSSRPERGPLRYSCPFYALKSSLSHSLVDGFLMGQGDPGLIKGESFLKD